MGVGGGGCGARGNFVGFVLSFFVGDGENIGSKEEKTVLSAQTSCLNITCKHELKAELVLWPLLLPLHSTALFPSLSAYTKCHLDADFLPWLTSFLTLNYNSARANISGQFRTQIKFIITGQNRREGKRGNLNLLLCLRNLQPLLQVRWLAREDSVSQENKKKKKKEK